MKKILFIVLCCICLCGCEEKEKLDNSNIDTTMPTTNENKDKDKYINISDHKEIKDYSDNLTQTLNNINNDNILKYNHTTFEKNIYFVEYITNDGTSFTLRFNDNYDFIGITIQNPNFEEYTEDFIQLRTKY